MNPRAEKTDRRKTNEAAITAAITENYLETYKGVTVKEVAEKMSRSEAWVRRYIYDNGFIPDGIASGEDHRDSYSKNFSTMATGSHKVTVYEPTKKAIAEMVNAARAN
jgi:hypothetical protein